MFLNIIEDFRPDIVDVTLPAVDEHLFKLSFSPSICVSAEETRQILNEWEFTFLTILCKAIYEERKIGAVVSSLKVPNTILNDTARVYGLTSEQNALTTHILFEWWRSARITLMEKTYLTPMYPLLHWSRLGVLLCPPALWLIPVSLFPGY